MDGPFRASIRSVWPWAWVGEPPQLDAMMAAAGSRRFDTLLVWRLDRLARVPDRERASIGRMRS